MMKKIYFLTLIMSMVVAPATAQVTRMPKIKIGILAPLYLDSTFNGNNYKYSQNNFPRFIVPGLDFIQGAMIALDSLAALDIKVEARILDSKSGKQTVNDLIRTGKMDDLDMIIASVKESEFLPLAGFAKKKKIAFISATFPNDAGIRDNPYTIIVNPTLGSHCETIFSYLLQNHGMDKVWLVRKEGSQEDKVESYFRQANNREGKPFLKMETIVVDSSFASLKKKLDSTRTNIIVGGSLDENFANELCGFLSTNQKKYPVKLIGMPNWDGFSLIRKGKYKDLNIYYSSSRQNARTDTLSKFLRHVYLDRYGGLPSEPAFQGFETTFYFGTLLSAHNRNIFPYLNEPELPQMPEYRFRGAFRGDTSAGPDYHENRRLFFLKLQDGNNQ